MIEVSKKQVKSPVKLTPARLRLILLVFSAVVILGIIFLVFVIAPKNNIKAVPVCGDGSFYNTCSLDKPYYCNSQGVLVPDPTDCGCPLLTKQQGTSCTTNYQTMPKTEKLSYVLQGKNGTIDFTLYKGLYNYLSLIPEDISYNYGQGTVRSDFKLMRLNEINQKPLLDPLVKAIENAAPNSKVDQARIAISIVQNIPWGSSGKIVNFTNGQQIGYSRYPYQVLYDNQGLCGEKSELLAYILRDLGYGVALFYYPKENHETLGIKCPVEYSLNGTGYCFVESSGPAIISDSSITYAGGVTLSSSPSITLISDGISLPDGLPEYSDAKTFARLRSRNWLDPISQQIFRNLEEKYGLGKVYNIN
jgi:hypothetical protein